MTCRLYTSPDDKEERRRPDYPSGKNFDFADRPANPEWCGQPATAYIEHRIANDTEPVASFYCAKHADMMRRAIAESDGGLVFVRELPIHDAYAQKIAANWDRL